MQNVHAPAQAGNRRRLPNRRPHVSFDLEHAGIKYRCGVGVWPDGQIGEIFLSTAKHGSSLDVNARDASIAVSLALQHGTPLAEIAKALCRDPAGRASGPLGAAIDLLLAEDVQ